jgi:hypothetical protein
MDSAIKNNQEQMKAEIKASQERMEAMWEEMKAQQERMIPKMDACLEKNR